MNLLAKREHEVPAELEKVFPGVDELMRSFFGRFMEPGAGLLRSSVFDSRWETEVTDDEVMVKISCPGCKAADFEIEAMGDFLNFRVKKEQLSENKGDSRHYIFRERACAAYEESIKLPVPVKGGEGTATYADGVVTVTLPREKTCCKTSDVIKVQCSK